MPRPKTRTGELRSRIVEESLRSLEEDGPSALTARRVAAGVGSSTAALYELFGDKAGLIRSLFFEGFSILATRLQDLDPTGDTRADVEASLEAIRAFAVESPMLYEIMFARPFAEFQPEEDDQKAAASIYKHITGRVADWLETERRHAGTIDVAQALVATNSGLIGSELAGTLGSSTRSRSRRRKLTIDALLDGVEQQRRLA